MNLNVRSKVIPAVLFGLLGTLLAPAAAASAATRTTVQVGAIRVNTADLRTLSSQDLLIAAVGANGLPAGFSMPAGTSVPARTAVNFALAQRGKPYVFGAIGPSSYDCSGLMLTAWLLAGRNVTRTTLTQRFAGTATTAASLRPGDLVVTPGGLGTLARPDHDGMYIGHGLVVHAPHTGDVVRVLTYTAFVARGVAALRHVA